MKYLVWCLVALLVVLHQDYWQWDDARLVFGFLPYTLAYHAGISMAAAVVWALAIRFCWPDDLEDIALRDENIALRDENIAPRDENIAPRDGEGEPRR